MKVNELYKLLGTHSHETRDYEVQLDSLAERDSLRELKIDHDAKTVWLVGNEG